MSIGVWVETMEAMWRMSRGEDKVSSCEDRGVPMEASIELTLAPDSYPKIFQNSVSNEPRYSNPKVQVLAAVNIAANHNCPLFLTAASHM